MALVTWTQQALDDLEAVCLFIARDAPQYAQLFATRVFRTTDRLEDFPQMGRIVPEIGPRSPFRPLSVTQDDSKSPQIAYY